MEKEKNSEGISHKFYIDAPVMCINCKKMIIGMEIAYVTPIGLLCEKCAWDIKND